jgi:hypothetical protein
VPEGGFARSYRRKLSRGFVVRDAPSVACSSQRRSAVTPISHPQPRVPPAAATSNDLTKVLRGIAGQPRRFEALARSAYLASASHRGSAIEDRWSTDVSDECCQEALVPEVGDQIQVVGTKVDQATRSGVVTDVRGRMVTVQWETGDQSVFVPAPGTLTVLGRADARRRRTNLTARASRSGREAIPARPSTTTKKATRKAPVPKTATKVVAKKATRKRVR